MEAYEKFGKWMLKGIASLPFIGVGILFKSGFVDKTFSSEQFWLLAILILLCISSGTQGVFLCFLAEERKAQRKSRPRSASSESDPVFTACGHIVVKESYVRQNIQHITVSCDLKLMSRDGCPTNCAYYYVPKSSGGGIVAGALGGGIIGALIGGIPGAVALGLIATVIGSAIEDRAAKTPLQRQIGRAKQEGRDYQIFISA